jgi:hypothetical protein
MKGYYRAVKFNDLLCSLEKLCSSNEKIDNFTELKLMLNLAKEIPYLTSKNGNYKLFYDIHIWINRHYFCYNIFLNKYFYRFQNIFQYILCLAILPEWINQKMET